MELQFEDMSDQTTLIITTKESIYTYIRRNSIPLLFVGFYIMYMGFQAHTSWARKKEIELSTFILSFVRKNVFTTYFLYIKLTIETNLMLYEAQLMMASNFERWKASLAFSQNQESAFLVLGF